SAPASRARPCCDAAVATSSSKAEQRTGPRSARLRIRARRAPLAACARIASTADVVAEPAAESGEDRGPVLTSRTPAWADGMPLADYLARRFPYLDAAAWRREIEDGRVAVNARTGAEVCAVRRGDSVAWRRPQAEPEVATDWRLVHEHAEYIVVDKPAHLPCHGDGAFVRHTLVHLLRQTFGDVFLVHRRDRETSGLVVAARSERARRALDAQFRGGGVDKSYLAVVRGAVAGDFVADGAIGRDRASAIALRRAVVAADADGAMAAATEVTVLAGAPDRSLVRCAPRTGRTHQIRVHLANAGHPVLGDKLYGRSDDEYLAFVRHVKSGGSPRWAPD